MTVTTLDYIDNITVSGDVFLEPYNEYWALLCLRDGLEFLYRQAVRCDEMIKSQLHPDEKVFFHGNSPALKQVPKTLLISAFHWYAVSACQYVRTVGAIAYHQDNNRLTNYKYLKKVIPEVLAFRDKVAAHFSWYMGSEKDNFAERAFSVLPPLSFMDDSFYVGATTLTMKSKTSEDIQPWSIRHTHEQLCQRYWPAALPNLHKQKRA